MNNEQINNIFKILSSLGGVAGLIVLIKYAINWRSDKRAQSADASKAEIESESLSDARIYKFLGEIEKSYKELMEQQSVAHNSAMKSVLKEVEVLKDKVNKLEEKVEQLGFEKRDLDKKVRTSNYIIDQALRCKQCKDIQTECPVIMKKLECEDIKSRRMNLRESINLKKV